MNRYAIIVTIRLKPGKAEAFKPIIMANAEASVREEVECFQFHVTQQEGSPDIFILYEVYAQASSIDIHKTQPHYRKFTAESKDLIEQLTIQPVSVLNPLNLT